MTQGVGVRVGTTWLRTIAPVGDLEIRHRRNGPYEATWSMPLRENVRPSALRRGATVRIYAGPRICWAGVLSEPDWDGKTFAAVGNSRAGESAECLTAAGAVTSKPNTAIDQAIARQVVPWVRDSTVDFGNTDIAGAEGGTGVDDPDPGKLNDLLNLWADENQSQWRITPNGRIVISPESEATAHWLILPGAAILGVADDDITDRVFLRYIDSSSNHYRTASYPATTPAGGVERRASITHLGAMTSTRATTIAQGMYQKAQAGRVGWTNGIEVTPQQIITPGGMSANLALVRAGQTVRLLDAPDPRGVGRNINVVLEETVWRPAEQRIQLNPVGLAAASWEQILEEANAKGDSR